jgi:hypothetical protein
MAAALSASFVAPAQRVRVARRPVQARGCVAKSPVHRNHIAVAVRAACACGGAACAGLCCATGTEAIAANARRARCLGEEHAASAGAPLLLAPAAACRALQACATPFCR